MPASTAALPSSVAMRRASSTACRRWAGLATQAVIASARASAVSSWNGSGRGATPNRCSQAAQNGWSATTGTGTETPRAPPAPPPVTSPERGRGSTPVDRLGDACTLAADALASGCPTRPDAPRPSVTSCAPTHPVPPRSAPRLVPAELLATRPRCHLRNPASIHRHRPGTSRCFPRHPAPAGRRPPLAAEHWADNDDTTVRLAEEARGTWHHYTPGDDSG